MFSHYRRQQIQGIDALLWPIHVFVDRAVPFDYSGLQFSNSNFKVCHPRCVCATNEREENVVNQHN